jgi:hypothetical protein
MACSDEDRGRSRKPGAEDQGWSQMSGTRWLGDKEVGWRCVRSTPCTWRRGARVSWLSLKTKVDGLSVIWLQNHLDGFLRFVLKTGGDGIFRFSLKTGGDDFLIDPQNQGGGGFPGLGLKTKQTLVYRLRYKTDGRI